MPNKKEHFKTLTKIIGSFGLPYNNSHIIQLIECIQMKWDIVSIETNVSPIPNSIKRP